MLHFLAVFAYGFPTKGQNKFKFYVFPYVYPYFHQDWSMFAPVPKQNFNLYVKYFSNGEWKQWEDIFYTINSVHRTNRFTGNEAILLALGNSLRYYATTAEEKNKILNDGQSNVHYLVLEKVIKSYLYHRNTKMPDKLQVIIGLHDLERNLKYYHYYIIN